MGRLTGSVSRHKAISRIPFCPNQAPVLPHPGASPVPFRTLCRPPLSAPGPCDLLFSSPSSPSSLSAPRRPSMTPLLSREPPPSHRVGSSLSLGVAPSDAGISGFPGDCLPLPPVGGVSEPASPGIDGDGIPGEAPLATRQPDSPGMSLSCARRHPFLVL